MGKNFVNFEEKVEIIKEYLEENNAKANNKEVLGVNTIYKGYPIGKWANFIRYSIKSGSLNKSPEVIQELQQLGLLDARVEHATDRVNRLIDFLEKYPRLWYNKNNFEKNLDEITQNPEERKKIVFLYNQAEEDYARIRQIVNRPQRNNNQSTEKKERIPEELVQKLIEANVGRALGYSTKNKHDREVMINDYGVEESVADRILRTYGSFDEFSHQYIEALIKNSTYKSIPKSFLDDVKLVTDFDLSESGFIVRKNEGYLKLAKQLVEKDSLIYDGKNIKKVLDNAIDEASKKENKSHSVADREVKVIRMMFGLDGNKEKTYSQISNELNLSTSRIQQIASQALNKIKEHSEELDSVIYDASYERKKFFINKFFEYNSILWTDKKNPPFSKYSKTLKEEIIYGKIIKCIDKYYKTYISEEKLESAKKRIKNNYYFEGFSENSRDDDIKFINNSMKEASKVIKKVERDISNNKLLTDNEKERLRERLALNKRYASIYLYKKIEVEYPNDERNTVKEYYKNTYDMINKAFHDNYSQKEIALRTLIQKVIDISSKNEKTLTKELDSIELMENQELIGNQDISTLKDMDEGITTSIIEILRNKNIFTIKDLIEFSASKRKFIDIRIRGLGIEGRNKIVDALDKMGLTLEDVTKTEEERKINRSILHKKINNNTPEVMHKLNKLIKRAQHMYLNDKDIEGLLQRINTIKENIDMDLFDAKKKEYVVKQIKLLGKKTTMQSKISKIRLSSKTKQFLKTSEIKTYGDLCKKTPEEIRSLPNFSEACYTEILGVMGSLGIHFKGEDIPKQRNKYIENNDISISKNPVKDVKDLINEFNFDLKTRAVLQEKLKKQIIKMYDLEFTPKKKTKQKKNDNVSDLLTNELEQKINDVKRAEKINKNASKILNEKKGEITKIMENIKQRSNSQEAEELEEK